jgi:hypothetical protein
MTSKPNQGQQWMPEVQRAVEESFADRPRGMPSLEVIGQATAKLGLPNSDAEALYDSWLANGFKTGNHKIKNWQAVVRMWFRSGYFPSQKVLRFNAPPPAWIPPSKETVMEYADKRRWARSFGAYCWNLWTGNNWVYFGQKISSDQQWQCLMESIEYQS